MNEYMAVLNRNEAGAITSCTPLDFPSEDLALQCDEPGSNERLIDELQSVFRAFLEERRAAGLSVPYPRKFDSSVTTMIIAQRPHAILTLVPSDVFPNRRFIERLLPKLGVVATVINAACASIASFVSFGITLSDHEHGHANKSGTVLGISGGILSFFIQTLMYCFSPTPQQLSGFGRVMDDFIFCRHNRLSINKFLLLFQAIFAFLLIGDTVTSAVTAHQEIISLGYRAKENSVSISHDLLVLWALTYSLSNAVSWGTFNTGIVFKGASIMADFFRYLKSKVPKYFYERDQRSFTRRNFQVILERNDDGKVISMWIPALNVNLDVEEDSNQSVLDLTREKLSSYVASQCLQNVSVNYSNQFDLALVRDLEASTTSGFGNISTLLCVEVIPKRRFMERFLPFLGTSCVAINAICVGIATFASIQLTLGDNENPDNQKGLGAMGGIFNLLLTIFIYYYSDTNLYLSHTGRGIDDFIFRRKKSVVPLDARNITSDKVLISVQVLFALLLLGDTLVKGITDYQEIKSLGSRLNDHHRVIPYQIINVWAWLYAISDVVAWGMFNASMVFRGSYRVANYLREKTVGFFSYCCRADRSHSQNSERSLLINDDDTDAGSEPITIRNT